MLTSYYALAIVMLGCHCFLALEKKLPSMLESLKSHTNSLTLRRGTGIGSQILITSLHGSREVGILDCPDGSRHL